MYWMYTLTITMNKTEYDKLDKQRRNGIIGNLEYDTKMQQKNGVH